MGEITCLYTGGNGEGKLMFRREGLLSRDLEWVREDRVWCPSTRVASEKGSEGQQLTCRHGRGGKEYGEMCFAGSYHCFSFPR